MSVGDRAVVEPSKRLPDVSVPALPDGRMVRLRPPGRRAPLVLLVHGPGCAECGAFAAEVAAADEAVREWDGYPLVVAGDEVAARLGVAPPAVIVADLWGEIHLRHEAGEEHRFPTVAELVEWLRFLSIQCPECQGEAY